MQRPTLLSSRAIRRVAPLLLASALTLAACGGGSSEKTTATSASVVQSSAAATSAATNAATTAVAVATSAGAVATTTSGAPSAAATTETSPATATASSDGSDVSDVISEDVAKAWDKVTSYKITLNSYDGDAATPSLTTTTETMKPDKEHTVSTIAGATIESIRIGDDTYIKLGDTWQKSPSIDTDIGTPESGDDVINDFVNPSVPDAKVVKKDDETIDGITANVFEITADDGTVVTIWIGKDDHLPRKSEITSDSGRLEILYSDYGKDFGIKAPI